MIMPKVTNQPSDFTPTSQMIKLLKFLSNILSHLKDGQLSEQATS